MNTLIYATVFVLLTVCAAPSSRAETVWHQEFKDGKAVAQAKGKDLLIDFGGSDWCLPCLRLKERVFSKPEFIDKAGREFVLVDIDLLLNSPIPEDRKNRYEELQERYGIDSFPTVVLALPDGRPYAWTTYHEALATPELYWKHLIPLRERGQRLREALARADMLQGQERAEALATGLSQVDPRFVPKFYADRVADLRAADPSDSTGYLAFLAGRRALDDFQAGLDLFKAEIEPKAVDGLIAREKLRGEALQQALVIRAAAEVLAGEDRQALRTFSAVLDAQASRTRFDLGDLVPLDNASIATVRRRIKAGEADEGDGTALYYSLHRIFTFDLPNPYEVSCGSVFQPGIRVRSVLGDRYGRALLRATEMLDDEARARALAKGLEGTFFDGQGVIGEIVRERIPKLVGKEAARKLLPGEFYPKWVY